MISPLYHSLPLFDEASLANPLQQNIFYSFWYNILNKQVYFNLHLICGFNHHQGNTLPKKILLRCFIEGVLKYGQ